MSIGFEQRSLRADLVSEIKRHGYDRGVVITVPLNALATVAVERVVRVNGAQIRCRLIRVSWEDDQPTAAYSVSEA